MANVVPLKANYTGSNPTSIGELATGDNAVIPNAQITGTFVFAEYNDIGNVVIPSNAYEFCINRAILSGTEEATLTGTGRLYVMDLGTVPSFIVGIPYTQPSIILPSDSFFNQFRQLRLATNTRVTLMGNSNFGIIDYDVQGYNRLVLKGRGY